MTKRIFRAVCTAAVTVLIASIVLIMGVLYGYFNAMQKDELKTELALAVNAVEDDGLNYIKNLDAPNCRLTWIDKDGSVIFDTKSDSDKMENHMEREEVREAFEYGIGESQRYSSTIMEKTLYRAQLLDDGTVLRISVSQATVPLLLIGILQPIAIVFIIALVISFILASRLSKRIVEPLNALNLDKPLENETYDEISPLLRKIARQQKKIRNQEDILSQKQNEFRTITLSMNEGLILLSGDKKIISLNPAAESFLSESENSVGKYFIEAEREHLIVHALIDAETEGRKEIQVNRNGRIYQLNISCIRDVGELTGFVILIIDVTEKINAESRRREFTANVSHELKTPLHSIMGSAELIENGLVKKEDFPQFIGNIRSESARLVTLIEDIIRLSQLDEATELPKQEFDLFELAKECAGRLKSSADEKNVFVNIKGKSTIINSVRPLANEIIYNLLDNAVKYNVSGGSVTVTADADEKGAYITVSDTGIGIPPEHTERVFERFYRVDKSRSKETGGTGLGLAIVKHAAEDIGASIKLKSEVGKGTVITVNF
ncbi:MAG: ATP-binding protein [Ruminococcus sp.]|nr:ATP-binding protein [Oscillospiraceae bacterium]